MVDRCEVCDLLRPTREYHHARPKRYGGNGQNSAVILLCRDCHAVADPMNGHGIPMQLVVDEMKRAGLGLRYLRDTSLAMADPQSVAGALRNAPGPYTRLFLLQMEVCFARSEYDAETGEVTPGAGNAL